ncbi:MAG: methyltransferase domain-containing protein [Pyrinomonadaceae bacterium]
MSLKLYEMTRLGLEPFLPPLHRHVRLRLSREVKKHQSPPRILDVGGRKSPYTIGIPAQITIIDLPRDSEIQRELNLGINQTVIDQTQKRRSNIKEMLLGDMTRSDLPDASFDHVVSVEVLEHVEEDDLFVKEVYRVLKPGGVFIMTTPNGDWVENKNPDHKRHYKKRELNALLNKYFDEVSVDYAIVGGHYRKLGLKSWSLNHPIKTASSILGNVVNGIQSANQETKHQAKGTHHLIAVARKNRR